MTENINHANLVTQHWESLNARVIFSSFLFFHLISRNKIKDTNKWEEQQDTFTGKHIKAEVPSTPLYHSGSCALISPMHINHSAWPLQGQVQIWFVPGGRHKGGLRRGGSRVLYKAVRQNPPYPLNKLYRISTRPRVWQEDVQSETEDKEPAQAFSWRSDQPAPHNKVCIKTICQEETTASYGDLQVSPVWNRSTHLQTRTSLGKSAASLGPSLAMSPDDGRA